MKKHPPSFGVRVAMLLLMVFALQACTHTESESLLPELTRAESIMYQHPDSALLILEQMPMPPASNRLQHATWCLLITQARYKNYIDVPNDSLINIAHQYFIEQNDPQRKALALYLEGALNRDWNEPEKAIQFYLDATEEVEKTEDYQLAHLIYVGLGNVYVYRALYQYAEEAFLKSLEYAKVSKNDNYISNSLLLIARVHSCLGDWPKTIKYYKESIGFAEKTNNVRLLVLGLNEISTIYTRTGNYLLALEHVRASIDAISNTDIDLEHNFLSIGDIYRHLSQQDSAYYYLNKSLQTNNIYTKYSVYEALYYLSLEEKDYKKALEYGANIRLYSDSIQKIDRSRALIEMQEKYDEEKVINEKNQLKIEKDRTIRNLLIILIVALVFISALIVVYQQKLIKKQRVIYGHEEKQKEYEQQMRENELKMMQNESRIVELTAEMEKGKVMKGLLEDQRLSIEKYRDENEALNKENEQLHGRVESYAKQLFDRDSAVLKENDRLREREKFLCDALLERIKELDVLRKKPKYLNFEQWLEVVNKINWLFDDFAIRLSKDFPRLSTLDIRFCCLLKLELSISAISIILAVQSASASRQKHRLKDRIIKGLGRPLGGDDTLETWLQNYW